MASSSKNTFAPEQIEGRFFYCFKTFFQIWSQKFTLVYVTCNVIDYYNFIIHPCDPTLLICHLIWPDMAIHITYTSYHTVFLSCHTVIQGCFKLGV